MATYKGLKGSYQLVELLGAGGNGEVWRADGPGGEVAVKLLKKRRSAPADAVPRFLREIEALQRLKDTHGVLPLLDVDADPANSPRAWFAMPIATTMRDQLGNNATLRDMCLAVSEVSAALDRVHKKGFVHRDIKPDNLYWYQTHWCLGDFGLADFQDAEPLTQSHRKLGPAYYIAPEMLNNPKDADGTCADVYSLGKTLWVLATGQNYPVPGVHDPTYRGTAVASYQDDHRAAGVDELLRRMTQLDPVDRPTADVVARELAILGEESAMNVPPDSTSALQRLRAALVPHLTREKEALHQENLAEASLQKLADVIDEIAASITDLSSLSPEDSWYGVPNYWGYRVHGGGHRINWEDEAGCTFVAGGPVLTWRLGIGAKCQLLSDGNLNVSVGYFYDRLINGNDANASGGPEGWGDGGSATNGAPSCDELIAKLIAGLRANLPNIAEQFAQLVEQAAG